MGLNLSVVSARNISILFQKSDSQTSLQFLFFVLWKIDTTGLEENQRAGPVNQVFFCKRSKVHLGYPDRKNERKKAKTVAQI